MPTRKYSVVVVSGRQEEATSLFQGYPTAIFGNICSEDDLRTRIFFSFPSLSSLFFPQINRETVHRLIEDQLKKVNSKFGQTTLTSIWWLDLTSLLNILLSLHTSVHSDPSTAAFPREFIAVRVEITEHAKVFYSMMQELSK